MLDIGWQELFIVAVIVVLVMGPKELPRAVKTMAQFMRKARSLAREFQDGIDDLVREAELDNIKKGLDDASPTGLAREIENTIDPTGELSEAIHEVDPSEELREALDTTEDTPLPAVAEVEPTTGTEAGPIDEPVPDTSAEADGEPAAKRQAGA